MSSFGLGGLGGRELVSVSLSEDAVRIAHAAIGIGGRITVSHLASLSITGLTDEAISHVVSSTLVAMGVQSPNAVGIMPTASVVTRNIEVPSIDQEEVRDIVALQASRHSPYAREDIIVDYVNMGIYQDTYTRVLLIVAGKDKVRRLLDILTTAGLRVQRVLFGPEAVTRVTDVILEAESIDPLRGIIHIDSAATDFIIAYRGKPLFVRNIPLGAGQLAGGDDQQRATFTEEIRKSLDVYQTEEIEKNPSTFIITGAVEGTRDLASSLDELLRTTTRVVSYAQYLVIADEASGAIRADANSSFLSAIGALYVRKDAEVELLPADVKSRLEFEERTRHGIKAGVLAIILLLLVPAILIARVAFKKARFSALGSKYERILTEAVSLEEDVAKIKVVKAFRARERLVLEILSELFEKLPVDAKCTEVRYKKDDRFSIKGISETMESVHLLHRELRKSWFYQKVEVVKQARDEESLVNFEIRCHLKKKDERE